MMKNLRQISSKLVIKVINQKIPVIRCFEVKIQINAFIYLNLITIIIMRIVKVISKFAVKFIITLTITIEEIATFIKIVIIDQFEVLIMISFIIFHIISFILIIDQVSEMTIAFDPIFILGQFIWIIIFVVTAKLKIIM